MKKVSTDLSANDRDSIIRKYNLSKAATKVAFRNAFTNFKRNTLVEQLQDNPKAFWSYVREVQGKRSTVCSLRNKDGEVFTNSSDKAN